MEAIREEFERVRNNMANGDTLHLLVAGYEAEFIYTNENYVLKIRREQEVLFYHGNIDFEKIVNLEEYYLQNNCFPDCLT
ncbi:hypothetical protein [Paenibacillus sp. NAIST15-1]|uniref:hypothetical protein n=1 Tax=Paenibacillus sp. NAIST15-1 TaxID=1605994 RepID=UPI0009351B70|nr:hypothetical protein [Paenibacillus sp. NAIST15-1]